MAVHAVERVRPARGDRITIVGGGPIGLLTALVAMEQGADVVLVSRNPARAAVAEELGINTAAVVGDPPAAVFECAGTGEALALCLELVAPLGRVVMVGVAPEPFAFDPLPVVFKEVDVGGSFDHRRSDFQTAIDLLAAGRIPSDALISDVVGLERAEETFRSLTDRANRQVKVLLDPALGA